MRPDGIEFSDRLTQEKGLLLNWIPSLPGEVTGFLTTRIGGESPKPYDSLNCGFTVGDHPQSVEANLRRIGDLLRIPPPRWARIRMDHGSRILAVTDPGLAGRADGMITSHCGLPLVMTVADCPPLFLWAPGPVISLLHCGWRGVARGMVENGIHRLSAAAGRPPAELCAWIGPGIGGECYPVNWDVAVQLAPLAMNRWSPQPRLDLRRIIYEKLIRLGLSAHQVQHSAHCTSCRSDLYYSHRRDKGRTGRMAAVMVITPSTGSMMQPKDESPDKVRGIDG
ncbi:MAG: polyphenol oxidase family protein [Candidatus Eisenbacteria bacterium]|nr:polyphenol oxidase family protein [Candidatus Eisenbacteria bacterium]MBU1947147.1 polyphenol oxidase family protein [Candidatus Eisenbacteria bacterium]